MKILIYICLLISFSIATDHSPRNISDDLELMGETTICSSTNSSNYEISWVCFNLREKPQKCLLTVYFVTVDFQLERWEFNYHYINSCTDEDNRWDYYISYKDNTISEYKWHFDGEDNIVDEWRKGKVDKNRINRQILSLHLFTQNVYYKGKSHL